MIKKARIRVCITRCIMHMLVVAPAIVRGVIQGTELRQGKESTVLSNSGLCDIEKRPQAQCQSVRLKVFVVADKRKDHNVRYPVSTLFEAVEQAKIINRTKGEYPFRYFKSIFALKKPSFKVLDKNTGKLLAIFSFLPKVGPEVAYPKAFPLVGAITDKASQISPRSRRWSCFFELCVQPVSLLTPCWLISASLIFV